MTPDDCRPTCAARRNEHAECVCAELDAYDMIRDLSRRDELISRHGHNPVQFLDYDHATDMVTYEVQRGMFCTNECDSIPLADFARRYAPKGNTQ